MKKYTTQEIEEAFERAWQFFTKRTWNKCFRGKMGVEEVSDKDWEESSFEKDDLRKRIIKELTNKYEKPKDPIKE